MTLVLLVVFYALTRSFELLGVMLLLGLISVFEVNLIRGLTANDTVHLHGLNLELLLLVVLIALVPPDVHLLVISVL